MRLLNKRGLSPLITTVLIIGFVIILAFVIFAFTQNIVEKQTDTQGENFELYSQGVDFSVTARYYDDSDQSRITVTNNGDVELHLLMQFEPGGVIFAPDYEPDPANPTFAGKFPIELYNSKVFYFNGQYNSVEVVPYIMFNDELTAVTALSQEVDITTFVPGPNNDFNPDDDPANDPPEDDDEVTCSSLGGSCDTGGCANPETYESVISGAEDCESPDYCYTCLQHVYCADLGGQCRKDPANYCLEGFEASMIEEATDCGASQDCWECVETGL